MPYYIALFIFLLLIIFVLQSNKRGDTVSFRLRAAISEKQMYSHITEVAALARKYQKQGHGLSVFLIKKYLKKAYAVVAEKVKNGKDTYEFENLIYDNYYKADEMLKNVSKVFHTFKKIPHVNGVPRLYTFLQYLVFSSDGFVNKEIIQNSVKIYNEVSPLTYAEVCAFKPMLEFVLLEYITIFCSKCVKIAELTKEAESDALKKSINVKLTDYNTYMHILYEKSSGKFKDSLSEFCILNGKNLDDMINAFYNSLTQYNGKFKSAVSTIFELDKWCGDELILSISPIDNYFLEQNGLIYDELTLGTKHVYLDKIFRRSKRSNKTELAIAAEICSMIKSSGGDLADYLIKKPKGKAFGVFYILSEFLIAFGLSTAVYFLLPAAFVYRLTSAILFFIPALFLTVSLFDRAVSTFSEKRILPKIKITNIKEKSGANIVCSRLIGSLSEAVEAVENLKMTAAANNSKHFSYTLLVDLKSAKTADYSESDSGIIGYLKDEFYRLAGDRFNLIIRKRKKVAGSEVYQGFEKKRGAINELNDYIISGYSDGFEVLIGNHIKKKYVVAIDSDTMLNNADLLLELMEHPYNARYTIMSLDMTTHPESADNTYFSSLFCGEKGINSYSGTYTRPIFDLFGKGNYTGKGIYRVKEFYDKCYAAFPDNRILSHDFIEGEFSGCGDSGVCALDTFPSDFSSFLTRQLRWLRGDWQLLPYLKNRVRNKLGKKIKNPVNTVGRMHILLNLLCGLLPLFSVSLIITALFLSQNYYILIILGCIIDLSVLMFAFSLIIFSPRKFLKEVCIRSFYFLMLPITAFYNLKAMAVTIFRLIRGKNLLEWRVFAHGAKRVNMLPNILFGVMLIAANVLMFSHIGIYVIGGLFVFAPIIEMALSRKKINKKYQTEAFRGRLITVAENTWQYFADTLTAEYNYLPCDNYQVDREKPFAVRTSPTNIGMAICGCISAYKLKIITKELSQNLVEKIITTVERLEKWRGNLYNWYDVKTLKVLHPSYVSSVDSGNFLMSLIAASNEFDGILRDRIEKLIEDCAIDAFYDKKRGLLKIGYNHLREEFDSNYYDLLGSESVITYIAAIATGKIPKNAWYNLSRRQVRYKGNCLYSWTGGMFEYLFPYIFFDYYKDTLLYQSSKNAVKGQVRFCKDKMFFGISESLYREINENGDYKYRAFGIPDLALSKSALGNTYSPYSSILSLDFSAVDSDENVRRLINEGMLQKYGLYESMDDTGSVKAFMAHHQGMILCSVCNYLCDDNIKTLSQNDYRIRAAQLLLTEQAVTVRVDKKSSPHSTRASASVCRREVSSRRILPEVNLLSNGAYSSVINERGRGYSCFDGLNVTRRRDDEGFLVYLLENGRQFDLTGDSDNVCFNVDSSEFCITNPYFESTVTASVLPVNNGEIRSVRIKNRKAENLFIELKSYIPVVLNDNAADTAHREYSNMFVKTAYDIDFKCVTAYRKSANLYGVHFIAEDYDASYQTNRYNFFGRGRGEKFGDVLDPMLGAVVNRCIPPHGEVTVNFVLLCGKNEAELKNIIQLCRSVGYLKRAKGFSEAMGQLSLSDKYKEIAARLMFGSNNSYKDKILPDGINKSRSLVLIEIKDISAAERLKFELIEYKKLFSYGISFNIAIIYSERYTYFSGVGDAVNSGIERSGIKNALSIGSTINVYNVAADDDLKSILYKNCIDLKSANATIKEELRVTYPRYKNAEMPQFDLMYKSGFGGYDYDYSYVMDLSVKDTPKPWSNVLANENFGTLITESGGGYTFLDNCREKRLSPFCNDAVSDIPAESIILGERGHSWSISKKPITTESNYVVRHGFCYSEFYNNYNGLLSKMTVFVGRANTKYYIIELFNNEGIIRNIDTMIVFTPVLGDALDNTKASLAFGKDGNKLTAKNQTTDIGMFIDSSEEFLSYTFNKRSITDKKGNYTKTSAFDTTCKFADTLIGSVTLKLAPKQRKKVIFSVGADAHVDFSAVESILSEQTERYKNLSKIQIETGNMQLDCLLRWLPYQVLNSRFLSRTGFYQSGGAYGFRDQLQDCLALLYVDPKLCRNHIIECCAHQFIEGDVQHWWHPPAFGIRTRFSDDRLFLPFVTAEYIAFTGDSGILSERVSYLKGRKLKEGQSSDYYMPLNTVYSGSVLEHCLKAIESTELNQDYKVLMKGGDWNDAMDKLGEKGSGITVWGTMFLYYVIKKFLPHITAIDDKQKYRELLKKLKKAVESDWDGEWYRRAVCDDGTVLGSQSSRECKIDLISQAFAVLSGVADDERALLALYSADKRLTDLQNGTIRLLDPPFKELKNVGYISEYPCGVRENGGQYTHGAVWFIMAMAKSGNTVRAYELLNMINPLNHCNDLPAVEKYKAEPYVISADVYSGQNSGQGGWSWYTGAASWYYKCLIENFIGISLNGNTLSVSPKIPDTLEQIKITYNDGECVLEIEVDNSIKTGEWRFKADKTVYSTNSIKICRAVNGKKLKLVRVN